MNKRKSSEQQPLVISAEEQDWLDQQRRMPGMNQETKAAADEARIRRRRRLAEQACMDLDTPSSRRSFRQLLALRNGEL